MRLNRRLLPIFLIVLTAVILLFFIFRRDTQAGFGSAVALCPGPDLYGYRCESGAGFSYIDATHDTQLYQDDGTVEISLPFPFTFYGTPYASLNASSNGNLQFDSRNGAFFNDCLDQAPIDEMGDMIAPFWDDLNLSFFGFLETELVGTAPNRIFVIEWDDVPLFGDDELDRVTFEVQFFEGSNDMVFLYEDTTLFEGNNGSGATIGIQSAAQGLALQFSCNQPTVADASRIRYAHPEEANRDIGRELVIAPSSTQPLAQLPKGNAVDLVSRLNQQGAGALPQLRTHWLSQPVQRSSSWEWVDLNGNGRSELILLWHSSSQHPEQTQLLILTMTGEAEWQQTLSHYFSDRKTAVSAIEFVQTVDLTGDGVDDVLIQEPETHQLTVVTAVNGTSQLHPLPEQCSGSLGVIDIEGNGRLPTIVRDGCSTPGRTNTIWNGSEFILVK